MIKLSGFWYHSFGLGTTVGLGVKQDFHKKVVSFNQGFRIALGKVCNIDFTNHN